MAQTYPLDPIIKKIDSDRIIVESHQKTVIVDTNAKTIVPKKRLLGSYKFYLVSNNEDPQSNVIFTSPPVYITDENNRTIICKVKCRLECEPGNEEILVHHLWNDSHPKAALDKKIHILFLQFVGRNKFEFIENYYVKKPELTEFLTENIAKIGLTATNLNIKLENELEALKPIHMSERQIPVRFKGSPEEESLEFSGDLFINDKKINAVAYYHKSEQLFNSIEDIIKTYFLTDISMDDIDLKPDEVKKSARMEINRRIAHWGRQFNDIFLKIDIDDERRTHTVEKDIEVPILGYPTPIVIRSKVRLLRQNFARYKEKSSPNLDEWVTKALDQAAKDELFETKYIDFLLDMSEIERQLRDNLITQAQDIGYSIKQLFAKPKLEQIDWLEPFEIPEIKDQLFETQVSDFRVKLTIPIKTRLRNLTDVSELLSQHIPTLMREEIVDSIQEFMHKIHPERFYMRFEFTTVEKENPVSKEIYNIISKVLKDKFNAVVISAVPKMGETPVTIKWKQLREQSGNFRADVMSLIDRKSVVYEGSFRVVGIHADGWNNFEQQEIELSMIEKDINKALESKLSTVSITELAFGDQEGQEKIERRIREISQNAVQTKYGLYIELYPLTRELTPIEKGGAKIDDTLLKAQIEDIENQIAENLTTKKFLRAKLAQEIRIGGDEDEILKIKNDLSTIKNMERELEEERKLLSPQSQERQALPEAKDVDAKN